APAATAPGRAASAGSAPEEGRPGRPPQAPDPWAGDVPPALAAVRAKVEAGERLSSGELREIRAYAREHEDDPRPHLLSGHAYFERRWRSDALERYLLAHRVAPQRAGGDPRMLANLVAMAAAPPPLGTKAADALKKVYGPEATDAVDAALDRGDLAPGQERRLRDLRESLAR
ncbi:MAG: hypothetical protein ACOC97_06270, partial [Myxococcota bacterium]